MSVKKDYKLSYRVENIALNSQQYLQFFSDLIPYPSWDIVLSLSESSSQSFQEVLSALKNKKSFSEHFDPDVNRTVYSARFLIDEILVFKKLYNIAKNWKTTRVLVCGQELDKKELAGLLACISERVSFGFNDFCSGAERYVSNRLGCHKTRILDKGENAWYKFVYLDGGRILVDKNRIAREAAARLLKYRFCPFLNVKAVARAIARLPDEIQKNDPNFVIEIKGNVVDVYTKDDNPFVGIAFNLK